MLNISISNALDQIDLNRLFNLRGETTSKKKLNIKSIGEVKFFPLKKRGISIDENDADHITYLFKNENPHA